MNVGTEQFRGLSQTSPRTIRDAEENQHGAIVVSTALEQIMRLSIGIGLCEPWQPPAWMDFVVLEVDVIIPSLCVRYGNIQSRGQLFNYLSNPRIHPVCQRIRIQRQPTIRTHLAAIIPSNPSKIIGSKHPTIAYKLFPFQCQAPHRHLQTLSII